MEKPDKTHRKDAKPAKKILNKNSKSTLRSLRLCGENSAHG
jgi:hypothetical protein